MALPHLRSLRAALVRHCLRLRHLVVRQGEQTRRIEEVRVSVKGLDGLLTICSHCRKVRDDAGDWKQLDAVAGRSEAEFSHGICPDCARSHYPDSWSRIEAHRARERGDPEAQD